MTEGRYRGSIPYDIGKVRIQIVSLPPIVLIGRNTVINKGICSREWISIGRSWPKRILWLKESIITLVLKDTIASVRLTEYVSIMRLIETKAIVLLIESIGAWLIDAFGGCLLIKHIAIAEQIALGIWYVCAAVGGCLLIKHIAIAGQIALGIWYVCASVCGYLICTIWLAFNIRRHIY